MSHSRVIVRTTLCSILESLHIDNRPIITTTKSWRLLARNASGARQISTQQHQHRHEPQHAPFTGTQPFATTQNDSQTPKSSTPRLDHLRHRLKYSPQQTSTSLSSILTDTHDRHHNYLRISLTERCNLRCTYCMPAEGVTLSPQQANLTTPEIIYLAELFVRQGVTKIRLTGGEPTVRKDILDLMRRLGGLRKLGLKELCLTTNGVTLGRKGWLDSMLESGLTGINLSLDSLDPFQYALMTRSTPQTWHTVMRSIDTVLDKRKTQPQPLTLKINCVVIAGVNDHELLPFVEFARHRDLQIRFIEYMPFAGNAWATRKLLPYQEMLSRISSHFSSSDSGDALGVHKVLDHPNDTSKTYRIDNFLGSIGFVTSMTENFCGTCNRLRVTSDGNLKVCLFGNKEVSLRDVIRGFNGGMPLDWDAVDRIRENFDASGIANATTTAAAGGITEHDEGAGVPVRPTQTLLSVIDGAVKRKKARHAGLGTLEHLENRPMILIGG